MLRRAIFCIFIVIFCAPTFTTSADKLLPSVSFHGYSGYFNVPTANVVEDGSFEIGYSNSLDYLSYGKNLFLTLGFLPRLEIDFRVAGFYEADKSYSGSDLSLSSQFLVLRENRLLPSLVVGWQDVGGESQFFSTKYLVISKDITKYFTANAGYGFGPKRLDGFFGALALKPIKPLELILEHDSNLLNAGVRLFPKLVSSKIPDIIPSFKIDLLFSDIKESRNFYAGFSFNFDFLNNEGRYSPVIDSAKSKVNFNKRIKSIKQIDINNFANELVDFGYLNIRVSFVERESFLAIEYENTMFNTNEMYAMRDILSRVSNNFGYSLSSVELIIKKRNLFLLRFKSKMIDYFNFVTGKISGADYAKLVVVDNKYPANIHQSLSPLLATNNFKSDMIIRPEVATLVGTEVGMLDYKFDISPELYLPIIKGGAFNSKIVLPAAETDDYSPRSKEPILSRYLYNQTLKVFPNLFTQVSFGKFDEDNYGILNESSLKLFDGRVTIENNIGFIIGNHYGLYLRKTEKLAMIKYYLPYFDIYAQMTAGRFLYFDDGYIFSVNRFFINKEIGFYFKYSDKFGYQGGFQFTIPLTPEKELLAPCYFRPRLTDDFYYRLGSTLFEPANVVRFRNNTILRSGSEMSNIYFDRDRFSKNYILTHLDLLRAQ